MGSRHTMGACADKEADDEPRKGSALEAVEGGGKKKKVYAYQQKEAARAEAARATADTSKTTPSGKERQGGVFQKSQGGVNSGLSGASTTKGYEDTKAWVEKKLGESLDDDLWEWAHDGKRLCKLANKLKPGAVDMKKLNKMNGPMFHMENIDFATEGFKKMLPKKYQARLFRSPDLYEKGSSYPKQSWICLSALQKLDEDGDL